MPKFSIVHRTTYRFGGVVDFSPHRLTRPRESRDLTVIEHEISIVPKAKLSWSHDVFGNTVAAATFEAASDSLTIESRARVDLSAVKWPVFDIAASAINFLFRYDDIDRIDLGALVTPQYNDSDGRLNAWARGFIAGNLTDTLSLLKDISLGIAATISYETREQEGTQTPLQTFDRTTATEAVNAAL